MTIKIRLDKLEPSKLKKQMRYAASRALNDSAFTARTALVHELSRLFVLRNRYTERGFRVVKSTKRKLIARVGTDRAYLVDHVLGGTRRNKAVPTRAIRRTPAQRVTRRRWPGKLLDKPRYFLLDTRTQRGRTRLAGGLARHSKRRERLLFRRVGRGKRGRLKLLYVLPERIRILRRFAYDRVVQRAHRRTFRGALELRLLEALKTAR